MRRSDFDLEHAPASSTMHADFDTFELAHRIAADPLGERQSFESWAAGAGWSSRVPFRSGSR